MNGSLAFGLVMYEKFGLHSGNRNLFDMIISFGSLISILQSGPIMFLVTYRNLFGPFENQNLVFGLLCVHMFGNITYFMITIEGIFVWYITVKVFRHLSHDQSIYQKISSLQILQISNVKSSYNEKIYLNPDLLCRVGI